MVLRRGQHGQRAPALVPQAEATERVLLKERERHETQPITFIVDNRGDRRDSQVDADTPTDGRLIDELRVLDPTMAPIWIVK